MSITNQKLKNEPSKFNLYKVGVTGTLVTAVLCFLPILAILLGAVGLGWVAGYLDYTLFPVLFIFIGLTTYAWWHKRKTEGTAC